MKIISFGQAARWGISEYTLLLLHRRYNPRWVDKHTVPHHTRAQTEAGIQWLEYQIAKQIIQESGRLRRVSSLVYPDEWDGWGLSSITLLALKRTYRSGDDHETNDISSTN